MITDKNGRELHRGDVVKFESRYGTIFNAVVTQLLPKGADRKVTQQVMIHITGDPFPVKVRAMQLRKALVRRSEQMAARTATKGPSLVSLRKQAKALGIEDYDEMEADELQAAIEAVEDMEEEEEEAPKPRRSTKAKATTRKATTTRAKTTAKGKATPKRAATAKTTSQKSTARGKAAKAKATRTPREVEPGTNPFREGSNSFVIAEMLIEGGTESVMISRLAKKLNFREDALANHDAEHIATARLRLVKKQLKDNGFEIEEGEDTKHRKTVQAVIA